MLGRVAEHRLAQELAASIDAVLGELSRARTCHLLPREHTLLNAAYLVDREHESEFALRAQRLVGTLEKAALILTGPWPPYSFVSPEER
jgi:hypothetical protein